MVLPIWINLTRIILNIMYVLAITTITGSILTLVWYVIGTFMEQIGLVNIRHSFLKAVLIFYIVPLAYIFQENYGLISFSEDARALGYTFISGSFAFAAAGIWICGLLRQLKNVVQEHIKYYWLFKQSIPCDKRIKMYMDMAAQKLQINSSKIHIMQSYLVPVPMISGIFNVKIIIPVKDFSDVELKTIFFHELMHYKQKDLLLKKSMMFINAIHFFNPIVIWLNRKIEKWCEFTCDYNVYPLVGAKAYFNIIMNMTYNFKTSNMSANLVSEEEELKERIEYVMKTSKRKGNKYIAALLVAGMIMTSSISVFATTYAVKEASIGVYDLTVNKAEDAYTFALGQESVHTSIDDISDVYAEIGEVDYQNIERTSGAFCWDLHGNHMVSTSGFYLVSGERVLVSLFIEPSDETIEYGIMRPDGSLSYVYGRDVGSHAFTATMDGTYKVYVYNYGNSPVYVEGTYTYR